jgi:hypothetical protein
MYMHVLLPINTLFYIYVNRTLKQVGNLFEHFMVRLGSKGYVDQVRETNSLLVNQYHGDLLDEDQVRLLQNV